MKKKKVIPITIIAAIMITIALITPFLGFQPTKTTYAHPADLTHTATISPSSIVLPNLTYNPTFSVNVTSTGTKYLNKTCIKLPTSWKNTTVTPPTNWTLTGADGWLNFTWHDTYYTDCDFKNGKSYTFDIPVKISKVPPTENTWLIYAYSGANASENNPVSVTVTVNLEFSSTMEPDYVRGGASYLYTVTTTNDQSDVGINKVNITFPAGTWSFNELVDYSPRTWTPRYDSTRSTFKLTGPSILKNESVMIKVNMTTPASATTGAYYWNSSAWDSSGNYLGKYSMKAVVDTSEPTVTFDAPTVNHYTVGSGNYIWINTTISDSPNIAKYGITVAINDTENFEQYSRKEVTSTEYKYFFVNKTAIPDGTLAVKVTATDPGGNSGSTEASTEVDNTPPTLLSVKVRDEDTRQELPYVDGAFWMPAGTTSIQVKASFYNPAGFSGTLCLNETCKTFKNETWIPGPEGYDVTDANYVKLNITITDGASPKANKFTDTWDIFRDDVLPSVPTFAAPEPICGGAIIRNLNATDNVGVLGYKVGVNNTDIGIYVENRTLWENTLTSVDDSYTFNGVLVLNLTGYSGKVANITIRAKDYGGNLGNWSTPILIDVPKGTFYPIELQLGWNLVSLPLIPPDYGEVSPAELFGDLPKAVYYYNATSGDWQVYIPGVVDEIVSVTDGRGYWVEMEAYNVLLAEGFETPPPEWLEPLPEYPLEKGWNLIGFKSTESMNSTEYLSSLQTVGGEWTVHAVYTYDADEGYKLVFLRGVKYKNMEPGKGYWIYMLESDNLVPP